MKRIVLAAVAASLGLLATSAALADTQTLATAGAWKAFGGTSNDNTPVCGISTSGNGLFFSLKVYKGDEEMTVQLGSSDWKIKDGAKQKLAMRFDKETPWNATATGFHFSDGDAGLEFVVKLKNLETFITEFAGGNKLRINFEGSDVDSWSAGLSGTAAVTAAFADCIKKRL
ncbi:MAG: hypothetical protein WCP68_15280 [Enhydrobacter sp.]